MINQRDRVIVELRDEACTLWASGWHAFKRRAAKAFPVLDFNLQFPDEEEAEESVSKDEVDPRCSLMLPTQFLFLEKLRLLPRLVLPPCLLGRGGKIGPARWAGPVRPKLGPGWAIKFLARKKPGQIWPGPV